MRDFEFIDLLNKAFSSMPVCDEEFFIELWENEKLSYVENPGAIDIIDEHNAQLICTALSKRKPCLIVLPDDEFHRGALMFGTALIKAAVECIEYQKKNNKVLFFGTSAGFKYSLSNTSVNNLHLDSVFSYTHTSREYRHRNKISSNSISEYLPEVIGVYHPNHPNEFIQHYKPNWVAIDCGKDIEIDWLAELVKYCDKKYIPLIAWTQNGFSKIIDLFEEVKGNVYFSPKMLSGYEEVSIGELFSQFETCNVEPIVFSKESIGEIDELLYRAKKILRALNNDNLSPFERDALKSGWIFLRSVERLAIPVSIYNAEANSFRYVYSLDSLNDTLEKYIDYTGRANTEFASNIREFKNIINKVVSDFETAEPPYWSALSDYCLDRAPEGSIRIIVFPKRHQKQIFSYVLLSRFDIQEDLLFEDSRIILRTLREVAFPSNKDKSLFDEFNNVIPIIAGLPDYYNNHLFYQVINKWDTSLVIYPHQVGILNAILQNFNAIEMARLQRSIQTLSNLAKFERQISTLPNKAPYKLSEQSTELKIKFDKSSKVERSKSDALVNVADLQTELSQLFEAGDYDEEEAEYLVSINMSGEDDDEHGRTHGLIIEDAMVIMLQDNYRLVVDPYEQVNILRNGKVEKIYVRGVRQGERVVLIENQSRQSLYDLIIARVHNHPSLEIHLAMLKKWKEDFYLKYTRWKEICQDKELSPIDVLLYVLQEKGSNITSLLTINNWVNGVVMSPHDPKDLLRLGEILDIQFLKENYLRVHKAASRIAGIHRGLSRKLNNWIEDRAVNFHHDDLDLIDEELGLTFGELRSSIKVLKVLDVRELAEPTLKTHLGRLEKVN